HHGEILEELTMKKDSTKDLLMIFSDIVTVKFTKGGKKETMRGRWCLPCKEKEGKLVSNGKLWKVFLSGGNSTCHMHIYKHYCKGTRGCPMCFSYFLCLSYIFPHFISSHSSFSMIFPYFITNFPFYHICAC
ncbi:hypothetical protein L208DRAFT_1274116, partial [Tricholoma matsutake]